MPPAPAPVRPDERIATLDLLRGVAICGILLMNIPYMGMLCGRIVPPGAPTLRDADWIAFLLQSLLAEGTMRGLFTLLFGAGALLMMREAEGPDGRAAPIDVYARRCLALMALGILNFAVLMFPGEILFNYGVAGLVLLAFRTSPPHTLVRVALALIAILSLYAGLDAEGQARALVDSRPALAAQDRGDGLTATQREALRIREEVRREVSPTGTEMRLEWRRRTSLSGALSWSQSVWTLFNIGVEGVVGVSESIAFMLIGMALFRTGVLTGEAPPAVERALMLLGYGGGLAIRGVDLALKWRDGFTVDLDAPEIGALLYDGMAYEPGRLLMTLGHLGLLLALFRAGRLGRARPVRALGRMALTTYLLQAAITSVLFYAMGWLGAFGFATLMGIAALIWLATGAFAVWWLGRFAMGPAEQWLRSFTYGPARAAANAPPP